MLVMESYSDIKTEIELIKEQIDFTEKEIEYWFGIDLKEGKGIPFSGVGAYEFGTNASLEQTDRRVNSYRQLKRRLRNLEYAKIRMDMHMERLEGLDYKIAYRRIVELKAHNEIAKELGYTEQYIRECWARIKTYNQPTQPIDKP